MADEGISNFGSGGKNLDSIGGGSVAVEKLPTREQLKRIWSKTAEAEQDFAETKKEMDRSIKRLDSMETILVAGFVVLIVMVATLLMMVLLEWVKADNEVIKRVDDLDKQIQFNPSNLYQAPTTGLHT